MKSTLLDHDYVGEAPQRRSCMSVGMRREIGRPRARWKAEYETGDSLIP